MKVKNETSHINDERFPNVLKETGLREVITGKRSSKCVQNVLMLSVIGVHILKQI